MTIVVDAVGDPTCEGELDITVSYVGDVSGSGNCAFGSASFSDLTLELIGEANEEKAAGQLLLGTSEKEDWSGLFFTSGHLTILQGSFSGTLTFQKQSLDYSGSFELD